MIRYSSFPLCKMCKHYRKGRCTLYGFKNVETGKIVHESASSCRSDKDTCGKEGKNYEYNPYYQFNAMKDTVEPVFPYLLILGGLTYYNLKNNIITKM